MSIEKNHFNGLKRYNIALVLNSEGVTSHKMVVRRFGSYVLYKDAMAEIVSLQAEIDRLNKALKSAADKIGSLKAEAGGMIGSD